MDIDNISPLVILGEALRQTVQGEAKNPLNSTDKKGVIQMFERRIAKQYRDWPATAPKKSRISTVGGVLVLGAVFIVAGLLLPWSLPGSKFEVTMVTLKLIFNGHLRVVLNNSSLYIGPILLSVGGAFILGAVVVFLGQIIVEDVKESDFYQRHHQPQPRQPQVRH